MSKSPSSSSSSSSSPSSPASTAQAQPPCAEAGSPSTNNPVARVPHPSTFQPWILVAPPPPPILQPPPPPTRSPPPRHRRHSTRMDDSALEQLPPLQADHSSALEQDPQMGQLLSTAFSTASTASSSLPSPPSSSSPSPPSSSSPPGSSSQVTAAPAAVRALIFMLSPGFELKHGVSGGQQRGRGEFPTYPVGYRHAWHACRVAPSLSVWQRRCFPRRCNPHQVPEPAPRLPNPRRFSRDPPPRPRATKGICAPFLFLYHADVQEYPDAQHDPWLRHQRQEEELGKSAHLGYAPKDGQCLLRLGQRAPLLAVRPPRHPKESARLGGLRDAASYRQQQEAPPRRERGKHLASATLKTSPAIPFRVLFV